LRRGAQQPLTVILDTSTTIFWNQIVGGIIQDLAGEIKNKEVVVILLSSLAKFAACGLDKYPGGVAQCYFHVIGILTNELHKLSLQYKLSPEAERFFLLFLTLNPEEIDAYIKKIVSNTDCVYTNLQGVLEDKDSYIKLGTRESPIPILSFHFDRFLKDLLDEQVTEADRANFTYLIHYYIYGKARKRHLPLMIRPSFGFAHAALTECRTALRMTLGIEDEPIVEEYISLFVELNRELKELMTLEANDSAAEQLLELIGSDDEDENKVRNFLENHQNKVMEALRHNPFSEFIKRLSP